MRIKYYGSFAFKNYQILRNITKWNLKDAKQYINAILYVKDTVISRKKNT